jgi:tartrate dehydrogenase/decarboxylase / D-malate dehydrogenase
MSTQDLAPPPAPAVPAPATPTPFRIAVIAGDGIGPEIIEASIPVVDRAAALEGITLEWTAFPWGCDHYQSTGRMMPETAIDTLRGFDAIYLGAIGRPDVPDHISVWELILPIRKAFNQYVNLRPMALLEGIPPVLAEKGGAALDPSRPGSSRFDMICVRENSEGEYAGKGGRFETGTPSEWAEQTGVFTRAGIERVARYAFEVAASRPRRLLASATKSNAWQYAMVLWDEVVAEVAKDYPTVTWRPYHVDALAARMVSHPESLDVILASNLFGDILSDLGAALTGSLGLAPGANLNPDRTAPSMFEPIHGSAPDIAGQGIANPIGTIWAGALMLRHLGGPGGAQAASTRAADRIEHAIRSLVASGESRTPDLGGTATTVQLAEAVAARL